MFIKNLYARNFRNFSEIDIELSSSKNLIIGRNGMGKTNILEAVYMLGYAKSFRSFQDRDLVKWGKDEYSLKGEFRKGYEDIYVELKFSKNLKTVNINGQRLKSLSHIIGNVFCIYMGFNDIDIIHGPPSQRRRFLNLSISIVDPLYLDYLKKYIYCLGQRNSILQSGLNDGKQLEIEVWNDKLVEYGSYIIFKRLKYIEYINDLIMKMLDKKVYTNYRTTIYPGLHEELINENISEESILYIKRSYEHELKRSFNRERKLGFTLIGPHRDDFEIIMKGVNARLFSSLGQMRSLAILLKVIQANYIESRIKEKPILLIDDVFLELDLDTGKKISELLIGGPQIIATTTNLEKVPVNIEWDRVIKFRKEGKVEWC